LPRGLPAGLSLLPCATTNHAPEWRLEREVAAAASHLTQLPLADARGLGSAWQSLQSRSRTGALDEATFVKALPSVAMAAAPWQAKILVSTANQTSCAPDCLVTLRLFRVACALPGHHQSVGSSGAALGLAPFLNTCTALLHLI